MDDTEQSMDFARSKIEILKQYMDGGGVVAHISAKPLRDTLMDLVAEIDRLRRENTNLHDSLMRATCGDPREFGGF